MNMGMVRPAKVPKVATLPQTSAKSSLGSLDTLPVEVLQIIFDHSDALSLSRLAATSWRGHDLVHAQFSRPEYADLSTHAREAIIALSQMKILHLHSVQDMVATLRSASCVCCGNSGVFLDLIHFERVCFTCLSHNPAVWVMPSTEAGCCFNLSDAQLRSITQARGIPGSYSVRNKATLSGPEMLVSVRDALRLALSVHGQVALANYLETQSAALPAKTYRYWAHLHRTQLEFSRHDPCRMMPLTSSPGDAWNGMGAIRFTHQDLRRGLAEDGVWCRGCRWTWEHSYIVSEEIVQAMRLPTGNRWSTWFDLALRELMEREFVDHARNCYGVQQMIKRQSEGIRDCITDYI